MEKIKGFIVLVVYLLLFLLFLDFFAITRKYVVLNRTNVMIAGIAEKQGGFLEEVPANAPEGYVTITEARDIITGRMLGIGLDGSLWSVNVGKASLELDGVEFGNIPNGENFQVELKLFYLPEYVTKLVPIRFHYFSMRSKRTATSEWIPQN